MEDWSDLFEPETLKKGYELFLNEAVEPFEVIDDGYGFREFEAEVEDGDEIFNVYSELDLREKIISELACDCPAAVNGGECCHKAAVLNQYCEWYGDLFDGGDGDFD